jgi:GntR family galactonate operon transcriptional repressor
MSEVRKGYSRSNGLHGQIMQTLGRRIVQGDWAPGVVLPTEERLCEELGVGRSALREGVKVLVGKGLLQTRTSAGTSVCSSQSWNLLDPDVLAWRFTPSPNPADIVVLANLRVALEPGAARLAAESADTTARRSVELAMAKLWATVDIPEAFIQADLEFHRAIFIASGNDLLLYIHDAVSIAASAVRPLHTLSVEHNRDTLDNHNRVAVAIRKGHHRQAEEAMRTVVEVARDDALQPNKMTEPAR